MAIPRKNVTNRERRNSIEKNLRREEEMISEFPDNPEYHLEKASNLIEMSLIEEFPNDMQDILQIVQGNSSNLRGFDYENSFLIRAIAEFDTAIKLKKDNLKYHILKAIYLEKVIIAVKLLKRASMGSLEGCILIPDVAGKEIIPDYLYDFIEHEILEEYDAAVALEKSEEMKFSRLHSKIGFVSRIMGPYAAKNEIERCIELYPQASDFHYLKAMELIEIIKERTNVFGRGSNDTYKECLEECEKAIAIEPSKPSYHLLKGYVLNALDQPADGNKEIDISYKLGKDDDLFDLEKFQIDQAFRNLKI